MTYTTRDPKYMNHGMLVYALGLSYVRYAEG